MPAYQPTWTDERIELLKSCFEAGLSCREIAGRIGVSRNAVIGKISRLNLKRQKAAGPVRKDAARDPRGRPALRFRTAIPAGGHGRRRRRGAGRAGPQRTYLLAVRAQRRDLPLADLDARGRRFLLLRQSAGRRPALLPRPQPARLSRRCAVALGGIWPNRHRTLRVDSAPAEKQVDLHLIHRTC